MRLSDSTIRLPQSASLMRPDWRSGLTKSRSVSSRVRPATPKVRRINVSAAFFLSIEFQETGYLGFTGSISRLMET